MVDRELAAMDDEACEHPVDESSAATGTTDLALTVDGSFGATSDIP